jgi:hypothetical protein
VSSIDAITRCFIKIELLVRALIVNYDSVKYWFDRPLFHYDSLKYWFDRENKNSHTQFHDTDFVGVLHFTMIDQCFIIMLEQESDGINT